MNGTIDLMMQHKMVRRGRPRTWESERPGTGLLPHLHEVGPEFTRAKAGKGLEASPNSPRGGCYERGADFEAPLLR